MADANQNNMGVTGLLALTGGTFNIRIEGVDLTENNALYLYRKAGANHLTALPSGTQTAFGFTGVQQPGQGVGFGSLPVGRGVLRYQIDNGKEVVASVLVTSLKHNKGKHGKPNEKGVIGTLVVSGAPSEQASDGDAATSDYPASETEYQSTEGTAATTSSVRSSARARARYIRQNVNPATYVVGATKLADPDVLDAIADDARSDHGAFGDIPARAATATAINASDVQIDLDYWRLSSSWGAFSVPADSRIRTAAKTMVVRRWLRPGSYTVGGNPPATTSAEWHDGDTDNKGPNTGQPAEVEVPLIALWWTYSSDTNPQSVLAGDIGKVNTASYLGAAAYTLKFVGYNAEYDNDDSTWYVQPQMLWRPTDGWYDEKFATAKKNPDGTIKWGTGANVGDFVTLATPKLTGAFASIFTGDTAPTYT